MSETLLPPSPGMTADQFVGRYEGLRRFLPGLAFEREQAAAVLRRDGLPTVRDEDWRYTSLKALEAMRFEEALTPVGESGDASAILSAMGLPDGPRLVFVDGRLAADLSIMPDGIGVVGFGDRPAFGRLARPDQDQMVALNTMLAEDGALIDVAAGVDGADTAAGLDRSAWREPVGGFSPAAFGDDGAGIEADDHRGVGGARVLSEQSGVRVRGG